MDPGWRWSNGSRQVIVVLARPWRVTHGGWRFWLLRSTIKLEKLEFSWYRRAFHEVGYSKLTPPAVKCCMLVDAVGARLLPPQAADIAATESVQSNARTRFCTVTEVTRGVNFQLVDSAARLPHRSKANTVVQPPDYAVTVDTPTREDIESSCVNSSTERSRGKRYTRGLLGGWRTRVPSTTRSWSSACSISTVST